MSRIIILTKRILEVYGIDKNLVQIIYTSRIEELLSNSTSINKVFAIGNKSLQDKIKKYPELKYLYEAAHENELRLAAA